MDLYSIFLVLSLIAGFLMAYSLGANDVANSMASSVGAKAITIKQAIIISGTLNFVGAVFLGAQVTRTISKGIINVEMIADPQVLMVGMFAALLSAGLWVLIATITALPVSSTHSIVGSILGFGLVAGGIEVVNWYSMVFVVLSWIISPLFGATISYLVFWHIRRFILYGYKVIEKARFWAPYWASLTVGLVILSFLYKTPFGKSLAGGTVTKLSIAAVAVAIAWYVAKRILKKYVPKQEGRRGVEDIFRHLQVGTACYVAVSQGANDVANAIGPVAAIYMIARDHALLESADIPAGLLVLGGVGIAIGIATMGHKVMATVGEKITKLNNTRGFSVEFGAATTVLMASNLGMPVSTTHASIGSIVGVGLARGFGAVDFKVLYKIVIYWVLTVPISAFTSIVIFQILKSICL